MTFTLPLTTLSSHSDETGHYTATRDLCLFIDAKPALMITVGVGYPAALMFTVLENAAKLEHNE